MIFRSFTKTKILGSHNDLIKKRKIQSTIIRNKLNSSPQLEKKNPTTTRNKYLSLKLGLEKQHTNPYNHILTTTKSLTKSPENSIFSYVPFSKPEGSRLQLSESTKNQTSKLHGYKSIFDRR
jgi:hypothetical protein